MDKLHEKKMQNSALMFFIIFIVAVLGAVFSISEPEIDEPSLPTPLEMKVEASLIMEKFIKQELLSPRKARFERALCQKIQNKGEFYFVHSYVDAKNTFNAEIRRYFYIKVQYKDGRWKLTEFIWKD